jgi:uncharacterized membrane protein (UPF0127 family)
VRATRCRTAGVAVLLLTGCGDDGGAAEAAGPPDGLTSATLEVGAPGEPGASKEHAVLVADTPAEHDAGLRDVDLGAHRAMAFVFDRPTRAGFWMRGVDEPLSIAFVDEVGEVISTADMSPCGWRDDCPTTTAPGPYVLALEAPAGGLDDLGVVPGARVAVTSRDGSPLR